LTKQVCDFGRPEKPRQRPGRTIVQILRRFGRPPTTTVPPHRLAKQNIAAPTVP
jgi:hypothetical protein